MDFNVKRPNIIVVDDFYKNPEDLVARAESAKFEADERFYKGLRSERVLLPYVKEEFERLLGGATIVDWLNQPANGVFQKTNNTNPIVYHSDRQHYAAAVYLTRNATDYGTSFWADKKFGCRRPPDSADMCREIYSEYNLLHADNWQLIDKVGGVFNRLVIWDAQMIHSASMYGDMERLVQLFFFNIEK